MMKGTAIRMDAPFDMNLYEYLMFQITQRQDAK